MRGRRTAEPSCVAGWDSQQVRTIRWQTGLLRRVAKVASLRQSCVSYRTRGRDYMARAKRGLLRRVGPPPRLPLSEPPNSKSDWPVTPRREGLTLVHVTASGFAKGILELDAFLAAPCRVFSYHDGARSRPRMLVYFFALKPAYRLKSGDAPAHVSSRFPFVFLLSAEKLGKANLEHIYPFDTGGAAAGAFDEAAFGGHTNPNDCLEDFSLGADLDAIDRHISWAFGSRRAYFEGRLQPALSDRIPNFSPWRSFVAIANLGVEEGPKTDKRASAIELAYGGNVPVTGNVEHAVIPDAFLQDDQGENQDVMAALRAAGVTFSTYHWQPARSPNSYYSELTRIVRAYLEDQGRL